MATAFDKILFPVDLSDVSPKMAPFVKSVAEKWNAEVHLLFVVRVLEHFTAMYVPDISIQKLEKEMIDGAERKLDEFVKENFPKGVTRATVVLGDASEEIVRYVNKEKMKLVVVGTHGRKGLEKVFFGSVA
ncbi:MAG: universal stress protein, partial [Proteobacteria bacterium]|nr:universal stress protein [Pseudomonadota bacterium]